MRSFLVLSLILYTVVSGGAAPVAMPGPPVESLDGQWVSAHDPKNRGMAERWFDPGKFPAAGTQAILVPGVINEVWLNHGWWNEPPINTYWYERSFVPRMKPRPNMRCYLRFGAVKRIGEIWLNGAHLGVHAGGENPFEFDVTKVLRPGEPNTVVVRVALGLTGGLCQHVTLVEQPEVRIVDAFARPDAKAGRIHLEVTIENNTSQPVQLGIHGALSEWKSGRSRGSGSLTEPAAPGQSVASLELPVEHPHLWDLNDPFLYVVTVRSDWDSAGQGTLHDVYSLRTGFRDFRIVNGYFELNGRRIILKSTHGNYYDPLAIQGTPRDMRWLGQDFPQLKKAGFNMMRFIISAAMPEQLDQADEMGFLTYSEHETSWLLRDPNQFGNTLDDVVRRDRNHPSLVIWGLLNETSDRAIYERARDRLPSLRAIDDTRVVLLNSARWDYDLNTASASNPGSKTWNVYLGGEDPKKFKQTGQLKFESGSFRGGAGDTHIYPFYPLQWGFFTSFATLARDNSPFFVSECGIGSAYNFIQEKREMEAAGAPPTALAWTWINPAIVAMKKTWATYGLEATYPSMEQMLIDSALEAARQRELIFTAIRGNPKVNGYNLTGLVDFWGSGEGVMDNFRVFKPGHLAVMQAGWAPSRWCLLVNPFNAYDDEPLHIRAALANEDALPAGDYPATLTITGSGGAVWNKDLLAHVRQNGPLAYTLFDEDIVIHGLKPGDYSLDASLKDRPNAASGKCTFTVTAHTSLPVLSGQITVAAVPPDVGNLLARQGARLHEYTPGEEIARETILIGPDFKAGAAGWRALYARAARGAHIIFLSGDPFQEGKTGKAVNKWLALPAKGILNNDRDTDYHKDVVGKVGHPLLAGLRTGLMSPEYYGTLLAGTRYFQYATPPPDAAAVAIYSALTFNYSYFDGVMLGTYPFHAGHFTLNAFDIAGSIGSPAADRLLLNIVIQAQADAAPLSPLPAGFDAEMDKLGQ